MALFVTSTGTDQGKTYVTRLLGKQLGRVYAIKPVISGYNASEMTDTALILKASCSSMSIEECSPWRFEAPVSPDLAAKSEAKSIDYDELLNFCQRDEVEVIEGAGGVMSPLTSNHTNLDLIVDTQSDALLVSSLYLGCISHILTALAVLAQRGVVVKGLVLSESSGENMRPEQVIASLTPQLPDLLPVFVLEYLPNFDQDWKKQPDLTSVALLK
ncbi:MAG: dethiobiotin synthase [Rickettsiales bacterium]|nr:dethiobiotin synthase [Rickettsiales bacterium]